MLCSGSFNYTVTDGNSCSFSDNITIYDPINDIGVLTNYNSSCYEANDGEISITMNGGTTPPGTVSDPDPDGDGIPYCLSSTATDFYNSGGSSQLSAIIEEVKLNGDGNNIDNNTAGVSDYYEDYTTSIFADITEGQSYTVDLILGDISGTNSYPSGAKVFIDYNIDGDFDDSDEMVGTLNGTGTSPNVGSITFTVPATGAFGATRMRVVSQDILATAASSIGPCDYANPANTNDVPWFGATEDYSIVLNNPNINATYLWSTGQITDSIYGLSAGNYSVTITDDNGCLTIENFTILSATAITVSADFDQLLCEGIFPNPLSALGSTAGNNYSWTPASDFVNATNQNPVFSNAISTTTSYMVTFTDFNGCVATDSVTITVFPTLTTDPINHN
jgi:hypothetical protein